MSAIVCGKRSFFQQLCPPSHPKRLRCSSSPVPHFSPLLHHLLSLFPDMDHKLIEQTYEACGNDLDSAIRNLQELSLASAGANISFLDVSTIHCGTERIGSILSGSEVSGESDYKFAIDKQLPSDGSEWVELLVREMMNASDVNDARSRASKLLQALEKSIMACKGVDASQNLQKENLTLKEQLEVLLGDNIILKRAVAIQHERRKEIDEKNEEAQQLKLLLSQYQEQLRTLEVNNYALTMHLKQAEQNSSISDRFHPDVF